MKILRVYKYLINYEFIGIIFNILFSHTKFLCTFNDYVIIMKNNVFNKCSAEKKKKST